MMEIKQKILIVDDIPTNLHYLEIVFNNLYVDIVKASSGKEALEALTHDDYTLAIIDVQMPEMDGYELAEKIRTNEKTKFLPIIFISAHYSDDFHVFQGYKSGAVDFLTKPFRPEILIDKVKVFLQLESQKINLNKQKEEIIHQRNEIEEKSKILKNALSLIEIKNKNITDSIRYAQIIQMAMLPPEELIRELLPESFIFYKPKDIVSGDFYWIEKKNGLIYIAAVDCTGHGVPGAFMSIIGYNILNQAINENNITKPSAVLNFLYKKINSTLRKTSDNDHIIKEGMDLALCVIDQTNMTLEFAGANNPMYLVRNNELHHFKADIYPLGKYYSKDFNSFSNNEIKIERGDSIYIFSDGFIDQFGGPCGKKFLNKNFKDLLLNIQNMEMKNQKAKLMEEFDNWKGTNEQIDDVLIMGIKI